MLITCLLKELACGTCGVEHAIPSVMYAECFNNGGFWHCPNGHQRGFREGESQRKEKDLQQRLNDAEKKLAIKVSQTDQLQAELIETKSKAATVLDRIAKGICPHCNRTFTNLANHMKSKHQGPKAAKQQAKEQKRIRCKH